MGRHKVTWLLSAALVLLLVGAAAMGVSSWTVVAVYGALIVGWFTVATLVKRDVDRLGGDGDWIGATVFIFPVIGLVLWIVKRRDLRRRSVAANT